MQITGPAATTAMCQFTRMLRGDMGYDASGRHSGGRIEHECVPCPGHEAAVPATPHGAPHCVVLMTDGWRLRNRPRLEAGRQSKEKTCKDRCIAGCSRLQLSC